MSAIYEEHKDDDGFLYISYSGENTFGGLLACWSQPQASAAVNTRPPCRRLRAMLYHQNKQAGESW
jgi:hypothetical protein